MIKKLHQIEITSRCNLACKYCVHPHMQRAKIDMDLATFEKALYWVSKFVKAGTQTELNLAGIGESTMHPDFDLYVSLARAAVGKDCQLSLATNGVSMTEEIAYTLAHYNVDVWVSLHRPEKAGLAINMLRSAGVLRGVSADPSIGSVDWAGQVDWPVTTPLVGEECTWLRDNMGFVLSDGRVTQCCFDGEALGLLGTVDDNLMAIQTKEFELCKDCHMSVPEIVEIKEAI